MSSLRTHARALPCRVADTRLAIGLDDLVAIHRADALQRNPAGQGPIGWLLDYREAPIVDLGEWLGQRPRLAPGADTGSSRVLVFDHGDGPYGLLVDAAARPRELARETVHPLPTLLTSTSARGLRGVLVADEHPWLLFDPRGTRETAHSTVGNAVDDLAAQPQPDAPRDSPSTAEADAEGSAGSDAELEVEVGTLPDSASSVAKGPAAATRSRGRLLVFRTPWGEGHEPPVRWGLSISQVLEVLAAPALAPVPAAPDFVRGLTLWRDLPLVVLDVDRRRAHRLGAAPEAIGNAELVDVAPTDDERLLVVRGDDGTRVGLLTRGAPRLLRLPVPHHPLAPVTGDGTVLAAFALDREHLWIPDLSQLVQPEAP